MTRAPQVGDRIQVTGTVTKRHGDGECEMQFDGDRRPFNTLSAAAIAAGTLLSRPLKVGDRVSWDDGPTITGTILCIDDDIAAVRWANGAREFCRLARLTLADSEGGK